MTLIRDMEKPIKVVECKDCKYYGTHEWSGGEFGCCTNIYGAVKRMEPDDFCSRGEKKEI